MKKTLVIVGVAIVVAVFVCIFTFVIKDNADEPLESEKSTIDYSQADFSEWENGTLIVNGKVCNGAIVRIHPDGYAVIPILRIVRELGGTTTQNNEDAIVIKHNGVQYTLNTQDKTLTKNGMNYSVFDVLGGKTKGIPYFAKEGDDFIVADEWAAMFISDMNAFKRVDSEHNIVYVDTKTGKINQTQEKTVDGSVS